MDPLEFAKSIKNIYDDGLIAVVLYGSAAAESDYSKKFSDANIIIVLDDIAPCNIAKSNKLVRKWMKRGNPAPLFFDPRHIKNSSDVFPLELLDIKDRHRVLIGDRNPFDDLEVSLNNLRHQCEAELKGKILHLRSFFAANCHRPRLIARAVISSWSGIRTALSGVVRLAGHEPPLDHTKMIEKLMTVVDFNPQVFFDILAIRDGSKVMPRKGDALEMFEAYLTELVVITNFVDTLSSGRTFCQKGGMNE